MGPDAMILVFGMLTFKPDFALSSHFHQSLLMWAEVAQSCLTLCNLIDCTVHEILQARILEWVAFPFSRGSSPPRDWSQVSGIAGEFFTSWATREALSSQGSLVPLHFLPWGLCHLHIWSFWYFSLKSWLKFVLHPVQHFAWYTLHRS